MNAATAQIDITGLGWLLKDLQRALIGSGQSGDLSVLVKDEARRLSMEIAHPPTVKQRARIEKRIRKDIGSVFLKMPNPHLTGKKAQGDEDTTWLAAGPNFLLGAPASHVLAGKVSLSGGGDKFLFYKLRGSLSPNKWEDVGTRGRQHVRISNRLIVTKAAIRNLFNSIRAKIGKRDASFAETAKRLGEPKIPQVTARHFPTKHNVTDLSGMANADMPVITFGSNAIGVAGLADKVQKAIIVRTKKMQARIKMILSGYASENNSGQRIHKTTTHES